VYNDVTNKITVPESYRMRKWYNLKARLHANLFSYGNGATAIGVRSPVYTARKKSAFSRA